MSLIVITAVAAAMAAGAGWLAAKRGSKNGDEPTDLESSAAGPPAEHSSAGSGPKAANGSPAAPADPTAALPLSLNDVVSVEADDPTSGAGRREHVERWLADALVAYDGSTLVGALYAAPEGATTEYVAVAAHPRKDIGWMSRIEADVGPTPPTSIELNGVILQRRRRLIVRLEKLGRGAPNIVGEATWAEYTASGRAVALVLLPHHAVGQNERLVVSGVRYDGGEYDRMGKAQ